MASACLQLKSLFLSHILSRKPKFLSTSVFSSGFTAMPGACCRRPTKRQGSEPKGQKLDGIANFKILSFYDEYRL